MANCTVRRTMGLWVGLLALALAACSGSTDASRAYSRAVINRGAIVPAENVRLFEYLNHYEQRFPEPVGAPLNLDLRVGNTQVPSGGGEVWLQVGLQAQSPEPGQRGPLNLALVLDTSGSMDAPDKLPYLKASLRIFLQSLRPEDRVAIVTYSSEATVLWPSQPVGDGWWIQETVDQIRPGGSTNLHAGLMLGLQEVERQFDVRRNNRVILLTDGIANRGVTEPGQIAADALTYSQHGIYLSTVGLGLDFNDQLLSTLAQQGRGAYHFIDSAQEMDKVFRQEVEGLVERVANDIAVSIVPAAGVQLVGVTGHEGDPPPQGARVVLYDMGAGDSQVLMAQLEVGPASVGPRTIGEVTLSYTDVFAQRTREVRLPVSVQIADLSQHDPLADVEILRNATIVASARALIGIDQLFDQGQYETAWSLAHNMELQLRSVAAMAGDRQMVEDADLFARYQVTLAAALGYDPASESFPEATASSGQTLRWGATPLPGDPLLPTLEVDR